MKKLNDFRGIRVDNGKWVYGYYVKYGIKSYIISLEETKWCVNTSIYSPNFIEVVPESVGEYIGRKDKNDNKPWYDWEDLIKNRDQNILEDTKKAYEYEIKFYCWVQWQLYKQLKVVKLKCLEDGILLMGDIPFLVSRDSVDVWANKDLFKYYEHYFGVSEFQNDHINKMCQNFLEGIKWTTLYYFKKCSSWTWQDMYTHSPFVSFQVVSSNDFFSDII